MPLTLTEKAKVVAAKVIALYASYCTGKITEEILFNTLSTTNFGDNFLSTFLKAGSFFFLNAFIGGTAATLGNQGASIERPANRTAYSDVGYSIFNTVVTSVASAGFSAIFPQMASGVIGWKLLNYVLSFGIGTFCEAGAEYKFVPEAVRQIKNSSLYQSLNYNRIS